MKKVDFNKLQAGDLVEVPRTQFAPMRRGWNGWLFSEAVVIRKGVGRKSKKNVVVVEMRTPAGKNSYGTIEATFYAENVFTTPAAKNARNILKKYGIEAAESFYKFIERDDVTGCDWIRFLIEARCCLVYLPRRLRSVQQFLSLFPLHLRPVALPVPANPLSYSFPALLRLSILSCSTSLSYTAVTPFLTKIMPAASATLPSTTIKHLFLILLLSWSVHFTTCISMLVLIT